MNETYVAYVIRQTESGFIRAIEDLSTDDLPDGEVLIQVDFSSLNYKDAMSASGNKAVTRHFPHTPGIDAAGVVSASTIPEFHPGDKVLVTGYDLGMNTSGGFGQYIRVPGSWVVPLPDDLSLQETMVYGTAGFTAALSVHRMEANGLTPELGKILVTGATGGVGSLAVAILAKAGYEVVAATGKEDASEYLHGIGAREIVPREEIDDEGARPLSKETWSGVVDSVGGNTLATAIAATRYRGTVASCGLVGSHELSTTVYPFILRGISLLGIDSANCPMSDRLTVWRKIATEWKIDCMDKIARTCSLETIEPEFDRILAGQQTGRVVLQHSGTPNE
jgi:putative YhdH/YhfP family quinone oxidoreductase